MADFRTRLISLCKEKGMTPLETADYFGINRSTFAGYAYGEGKRPKYERLIEMADFFDCTVDYLIGRTNQKKNFEPVFIGDTMHFKQLYESSPESVRPLIADCFTAFYSLLYDDIKNKRWERLREYLELLKIISTTESQLKELAESLTEAPSIPLAVSDLMDTMEHLKAQVGISLEHLLQSDLTACGDRFQEGYLRNQGGNE